MKRIDIHDAVDDMIEDAQNHGGHGQAWKFGEFVSDDKLADARNMGSPQETTVAAAAVDDSFTSEEEDEASARAEASELLRSRKIPVEEEDEAGSGGGGGGGGGGGSGVGTRAAAAAAAATTGRTHASLSSSSSSSSSSSPYSVDRPRPVETPVSAGLTLIIVKGALAYLNRGALDMLSQRAAGGGGGGGGGGDRDRHGEEGPDEGGGGGGAGSAAPSMTLVKALGDAAIKCARQCEVSKRSLDLHALIGDYGSSAADRRGLAARLVIYAIRYRLEDGRLLPALLYRRLIRIADAHGDEDTLEDGTDDTNEENQELLDGLQQVVAALDSDRQGLLHKVLRFLLALRALERHRGGSGGNGGSGGRSSSRELLETWAPLLCRPAGSAYMSLRHVQDLPSLRIVLGAFLSYANRLDWLAMKPVVYRSPSKKDSGGAAAATAEASWRPQNALSPVAVTLNFGPSSPASDGTGGDGVGVEGIAPSQALWRVGGKENASASSSSSSSATAGGLDGGSSSSSRSSSSSSGG
eukprot:g1558.t1